ncbi:hypothetical protein ABXV22_01910 [Vibrio rotiferianus]|uniref:hypothetical protein n=1 Tax=Vibrio rotiferianus TaxID=190895 RepID=UPI003399EAA5
MEKISKESLKQKLDAELKAQGFVLEGEFAMAGKFAQAIANAVADEINSNSSSSDEGNAEPQQVTA